MHYGGDGETAEKDRENHDPKKRKNEPDILPRELVHVPHRKKADAEAGAAYDSKQKSDEHDAPNT
jgi:hypothetical protein